MNIKRTTILATCFAVALAAVAEPTLAKKRKNKKQRAQLSETLNLASQGYPNGRPWQALEYDFTVIMNQLDMVDARVVEVKGDTEEILDSIDGITEGLDGLEETLDDIAADVASLKNTLQVEVSVEPDAGRNNLTDTPVTLFVQVSRDGTGVDGLSADDFSYMNSFPASAAGYCGAACFTAGLGGVYAIVLEGDWGAMTYAGSLAVESAVDETTAHGSSLVSFTIPEAEPEP